MQFKVPQNIDMQDKVIGPLTMVQFVYAIVGFGGAYALYITIPAPFSYVFVIPVVLFVLCLDFLKINERPFLDFFISAIAYSSLPKKRFWEANTGGSLTVEIYHRDSSNVPVIQQKNISRSAIDVFAKNVDSENAEENDFLIKR